MYLHIYQVHAHAANLFLKCSSNSKLLPKIKQLVLQMQQWHSGWCFDGSDYPSNLSRQVLFTLSYFCSPLPETLNTHGPLLHQYKTYIFHNVLFYSPH